MGLGLLGNLPVPMVAASSSATTGNTGVRIEPSSPQGVASAALKPDPSDAIQYVSDKGSDSNDGLSWGSAKLTIAAACAALPSGNSSCTAGSGIVYVSSGFTETIPTVTAGGSVTVDVLTPSALRMLEGGGFSGQDVHVNQFIVNGLQVPPYCGQGSPNYCTEALTAGLNVPSTSTVHNANALGAYVLCGSASSNCVASYAVANAAVNGTNIWGTNPATNDGGYSNVTQMGVESDVDVTVPSGTAWAYDAEADMNAAPSESDAYHIAVPHGGNQWTHGLFVSGGATQTGVFLGQVCGSGNCQSADIQFESTVNGVPQGGSIWTDANGNLILDTYQRTNYLLSGGGLALGDPSGRSLIQIMPSSSATGYTMTFPPMSGFIGLNGQATSGYYVAKRGVAGCTTGSTQGSSCSTAITVAWPTAFADTNYSATCSPSGVPSGFPSAPYIASKATGSITVNYIALTAASASWPTLDCIAVHD